MLTAHLLFISTGVDFSPEIVCMLCLASLTKILCRWEKSNPKVEVKYRFHYGKIEFYTGKKPMACNIWLWL